MSILNLLTVDAAERVVAKLDDGGVGTLLARSWEAPMGFWDTVSVGS